MNFLPQEVVNQVMEIRRKALVNFGYSLIKDLPSHKYSGAIRFHIPGNPYKANYLSFYRKETCELIYFSKKAIKKILPEISEELMDKY